MAYQHDIQNAYDHIQRAQRYFNACCAFEISRKGSKCSMRAGQEAESAAYCIDHSCREAYLSDHLYTAAVMARAIGKLMWVLEDGFANGRSTGLEPTMYAASELIVQTLDHLDSWLKDWREAADEQA